MDRRYRKRMENYWRREERKSVDRFSRLDLGSWFDVWHTHPDWNAKGNRCTENRMAVAALTYKLLKHARSLLLPRGSSVQCWATFCENTGDNAIYLHSKNPNGTPFPYDFERACWGVEPPPEMRGLIDTQQYEMGKFDYPDAVHVVRSRE